MQKSISLYFFILISTFGYGQQLFESGIIYGGITGGGFSTNTGSGTITTNILIPPNSKIKNAYLLATRNNEAPNINIVLNSNSYTFSDSTIISNNFTSFNSSSYSWNKSSIHAIEITKDIDSSTSIYNLTTPPQSNHITNGYYSSFYIYI